MERSDVRNDSRLYSLCQNFPSEYQQYYPPVLQLSETIDVSHQKLFLYTPLLYCIVGFFIYLIQVVLFKDNNELIIKMSLYDWGIICIIAFLAVSYQSLMALGFRNEKAGRASMINYFQILFTFLADIFIFKRETVFLDYIGILLIFGFNFTNSCIKVYYRKKEIVNNH